MREIVNALRYQNQTCACRRYRLFRSRCLLVFVDDATGSVASVDAEGVEIDGFGWKRLVRRRAGQCHAGSVGVVAGLVLAQDTAQVGQVPDERAAEQFATTSCDPALQDRVHVMGGRAQHVDAPGGVLDHGQDLMLIDDRLSACQAR
jgi:hypothetical protein